MRPLPVMLLLAAVPTIGVAQADTPYRVADFLTDCRSAEPADRAICQGFTAGLIIEGQAVGRLCSAGGIPVATGVAILEQTSWPDLDAAFVEAGLTVLARAFPCPR